MTSYRITFITPQFSKGSYDDRPEIRPASIRGQLHWWFRALGGSYADEKAIFGGVHGGAVASKIVVRVGNIQGQTDQMNTLPHKSGGEASPKWAYKPGTSFDLHLTERLGGLDDRLQKALRRTIETWLLLGTLGLRATRAGGSFTWQPLTEGAVAMPIAATAWAARCDELLNDAPLKFAVLPGSVQSAEAARRIVSDTIGGRDDRQGESDLTTINYPLGKIFNGRKTSPLRFRIIQPGGVVHIAAVWDDREAVTGNRPGDLTAIIQLLSQKGKDIGRRMSGAFEHPGRSH